MKVGCPACGSHFDLDAGVSDADARRFSLLVAGLPGNVGKALIGYLALFRPKKTGLRWSRMLTIAQELEPMIQAAEVRRNGTLYRVPAESWAKVLSQLANDPPKTLVLPLKGNGYLLEILASEAERLAGRQEQDIEDGRRAIGAADRSGPASVAEHLQKPSRRSPPPDWRDEFIPRTKETNDG